MFASIPPVQVDFDVFPLGGGLDLHTPQLQLKPGVAYSAQNYECSINGGYTRIPGYERFDGRTSPSAAAYSLLEVTLTGSLAVGNTISGATSGATGVVCAIDGTTVAYTKSTGAFVAGETITVSGSPVGTVDDVSATTSDRTAAATYSLAAADIYRADIAAPTGVGAIRGGIKFEGATYVFRNNVGNTACDLWKSTSSGWTQVSLRNEVEFTSGSGTPPAEGATITQGAVNATVRRVVLQSGTWGAGSAAGRFIIDTPTGGSFVAGALTAGATATLAGAQTAITLQPSGRFEMVIGNAGNGRRIYGCDGVNRGFEFDGSVFVPIETGMPADAPSHVCVHKRHLFFSFDYSAQHSGIGKPYEWTPITGAAELAVDNRITAFLALPGSEAGGALAIVTSTGTAVLYGNSSADWNLDSHVLADTGGKAYSARTVGQPFVFDDTGIVALRATQAHGNFDTNSLTANIRSFIQARRTLVSEALVNREKSQYRVFFSDGFALWCTIINGKFVGAMPVFFPVVVNCAWSGEAANGAEESYFGGADGMVYRMDIGTSFDGEAIDSHFATVFNPQGNSSIRKRYRHLAIEMQGDGYTEFDVGYDLAYGSEAADQPVVPTTVGVGAVPAVWDSFTWDLFTWDGRSISPSRMKLEGTAENISLRVEQSSALWPSHTINSVALHYTPRRLLRA